jgi:hypothetical protein
MSASPAMKQIYIITLECVLYVGVDLGLACLVVGELPIIGARSKDR